MERERKRRKLYLSRPEIGIPDRTKSRYRQSTPFSDADSDAECGSFDAGGGGSFDAGDGGSFDAGGITCSDFSTEFGTGTDLSFDDHDHSGESDYSGEWFLCIMYNVTG